MIKEKIERLQFGFKPNRIGNVAFDYKEGTVFAHLVKRLRRFPVINRRRLSGLA